MRSPPLLLTMFAALAMTRCSAGDTGGGTSATPGEDASMGSNGSSSRDGSAPPSPTATGSAPAPSGTGTGPSPADGGEDDAQADTNRDSATADGIPQDFFAHYEAESSINVLTYPVEGISDRTPCEDGGLKEGANCASGGKNVNQILGRSPCDPPTSTSSYKNCQNKGGGVLFKQVTVPVDGTYDVTVWYHSGGGGGNADTYGDAKCGGVNYQTGKGSGCRPHLIDVNGVPVSGTIGGKTAPYYEFPAYPTDWSYVHGAVVALALKAGENTIYIHAPGFTTSDAADLDALDVQPSGSGAPHFQASGNGGPPTSPIGLITPVVNWN